MQNFIINKLKNKATDADLLLWWNEYDSDIIGGGQILESLEEWEEILSDGPLEFARRVYFGDVDNWYDNYFWLDGYANFKSSHSLTSDESPLDLDALAQWLIDDQPNYIQDWIDEWEEQNETEAEE